VSLDSTMEHQGKNLKFCVNGAIFET